MVQNFMQMATTTKHKPNKELRTYQNPQDQSFWCSVMQGPLAIYSLTHRFDHHQEAQPSNILPKKRYSLEKKHTACTQKITRNCHTKNTSAKYTTTNALRNYKKTRETDDHQLDATTKNRKQKHFCF
jgi:hypothetical protein